MKLKHLIDAVAALETMQAKPIGSTLTLDEWLPCMDSAIALRLQLDLILATLPEVEVSE